MESKFFKIESISRILLFLFILFFYEANAEIITLRGGIDTHTYGNDPDADYSEKLIVEGTPISDCNPAMGRAYIKFDITPLPINVKQVLFGVTHREHDWYCYSNCNADFYFYPVLETWEDNTLNYNNSPIEDNIAIYGPISISFPNDFGNREYDITELYRKWKSGELDNEGISIHSPTVGCNNAAVEFMFFSSEDENLTKRPYLKVITEDQGIQSNPALYYLLLD
jgi:hypothetical protein